MAVPRAGAGAGAGSGAGSGSGGGSGGDKEAAATKSQEDMDLEALLGFAEEVENEKFVKEKTMSQPPIDLGTREDQISA